MTRVGTAHRLRSGVRSLRATVQRRGPQALLRALRLAGAAVAAYGTADLLLSEPLPILAPLTALLVVQVSLYGTLTDSAKRIVSVLAGVALALAFANLVPFAWWSLGILIAAAIVVGQLLRLGPHLLEVPISGMLVLSVGASESVASDRVVETLVGAVVGVGVNLLFPPAVQTRTAGDAVNLAADAIAGFLDRMSDQVLVGVSPEQVTGWLEESRRLSRHIATADSALVRAQQSRRLNPRAVGTVDPTPELRSGLEALEHASISIRSLCRAFADRVAARPDADGRYAEDVRGALAALLSDLAEAVRTFGALVRLDSVVGHDPPAESMLTALDTLREARAGLTHLLLVDPSEDSELWALHGSLLASVERVLRELEGEERRRAKGREALDRLAARPRGVQAVDSLVATTRQITNWQVSDGPGDDRGDGTRGLRPRWRRRPR